MTDSNINNNNPIDMVMSNLSPEDQAQVFQLLKVEAGMTLTMRKNGAVADGVDVDIAQVCFNNMDESTKPLVVDYKIEGGTAVFLENKLTTIRKHTNKSLSSTVQLINLTPGKGMIKATPYLNPKMAPLPVEYEFIRKPRKLKLVLTVDTDNQLSDGVAANGVTATLTDEDNKPVKDEAVSFQLSAGTAQFKGNSSGKTDADGKIKVFITSNANAETAVTVTCIVTSDSSVSERVDVHFTSSSGYKITLTKVNDNAPANGTARITIVAKVTDKNGNPVSGQQLNFSAPNTTGGWFDNNSWAISFITGQNGNKPGEAVVTVRNGLRAEAITVTCVLNINQTIKNTIAIKFVEDIAGYKLVLTKLYDNALANGIHENAIGAKLTDRSGNPVSGQQLNFSVPNTTGGRFDNNTQAISYITGQNGNKPGEAAFFIRDGLRAEVVTVTCVLAVNTTISQRIGVNFIAIPVAPPPPPPPPPVPTVPNWPITVVIGDAECTYGPTYPISHNYHRSSLHIVRNSVRDQTFTISIISNSQSFALGDAAGRLGTSIPAYAPQTFFLGILKSVFSDIGATIEIRAAQGVVWRGIVYPRSLRYTLIN